MVRLGRIEELSEISEVIMEVYHLHLRNRPDVFRVTNDPPNLEHYKELIESDSSDIFVYAYEGKIVGYTTLLVQEKDNHPLLNPYKLIVMEDLAVLESYQRKGFGKSLFNRAVQYKHEKKADWLRLSVWGFNENAKKFYQSLGMNERQRILEL